MQAAVIYKPGDIRLEEVPKPTAKKGEALLRVAAVGVCGSDIPRMLTKGAHRMPIICGHEFSGHIVDVGEGVRGFDVGELVGVAPLLPLPRLRSMRDRQFLALSQLRLFWQPSRRRLCRIRRRASR